jgi:hypothetical protein
MPDDKNPYYDSELVDYVPAAPGSRLLIARAILGTNNPHIFELVSAGAILAWALPRIRFGTAAVGGCDDAPVPVTARHGPRCLTASPMLRFGLAIGGNYVEPLYPGFELGTNTLDGWLGGCS